MKNLLLVCACAVWGMGVLAQGHIPVFPNLQGEELLTALRTNYKPATVLPFANARDTLFSKIYGHNDSLTCVYTGFTIYLDPTMDPTVAAFMNGGSNGLNTEHTYPKAKGADTGNAEADMHHLYATRIDVNADRADLPFAEVADNQAHRWYYLGQNMTNPPTTNIDQYSEAADFTFEPREDHKGNVARAMFYFYTMYRQEADQADNSYFPEQRSTLCQWHALDPVDEAEWTRTFKIAQYQDGKPNPFILDCTLAERTYCPEMEGLVCMPTAVSEPGPEAVFVLSQNHPNPFSNNTTLNYQLFQAGEVRIDLYNSTGQWLGLFVNTRQSPGEYALEIPAASFSCPGLYACRMTLVCKGRQYGAVKTMIKASY